MLGLMFALASAFLDAVCAVLNRALKETPTPVIIFYHTIIGFIIAWIYIITEMLITGNGTRLSDYTLHQYLIVAAASVFDSGALLLGTLAF